MRFCTILQLFIDDRNNGDAKTNANISILKCWSDLHPEKYGFFTKTSLICRWCSQKFCLIYSNDGSNSKATFAYFVIKTKCKFFEVFNAYVCLIRFLNRISMIVRWNSKRKQKHCRLLCWLVFRSVGRSFSLLDELHAFSMHTQCDCLTLFLNTDETVVKV